MESLAVTVAVLQPFPFVFRVEGGGPPLDAPWHQLRKTVVEADPDDSLREIMRCACGPLGVTLEPEMVRSQAAYRAENGLPPLEQDAADVLVYVAFRKPDDDAIVADDGFGRVLKRQARLRTTVLLAPDAEGRVMWRRPPFDATMKELLDAERAGLLEGNPREVYLIPSVPQGDLGLLGVWQDFVDVLKILWELTDAASRIGGAAGFAILVKEVARRRSRAGYATVQRHAREWQERGANPIDLLRFLASEPRCTADAARWLGCSEPEAAAIFWAFGYSRDDATDLWVRRGDPCAQLIADDIELSFHDIYRQPGGRSRFEKLADERLRQLAATGSFPSNEEIDRAIWDDVLRDPPPKPRRIRLPRRRARRRSG